MVTNSVSPYEGALVWVGQPSSGISQTTGQTWKVVDFVLKYTDGQMQERFIALNASGVERVDKLLSLPLGTILRVDFQITARKSEYNGQEKWWGTLSVFRITPVPQQQAQTGPTAQSQPVQQGQNFPPYPPQQQAYGAQPAMQQPIQQPMMPMPAVKSEDDLPF